MAKKINEVFRLKSGREIKDIYDMSIVSDTDNNIVAEDILYYMEDGVDKISYNIKGGRIQSPDFFTPPISASNSFSILGINITWFMITASVIAYIILSIYN